jgi:arylsulfatase A-like enzyme
MPSLLPFGHFILVICAFWGTSALAADKSPSVIVMLADDAGWGDYGVNGNRQVATPNIDQIATQGAILDRFFVCPVCSPTRAEWLTGRYHLRGGVRGVSTGQERLDLDERTIADAFKAAGYSTGAFGKWHNGSQWPYHPVARGFDEYVGHTSGHWGEYFDPELEAAKREVDRPEIRGELVRHQGYIVDICTDRAVDFIKRHRDRPFLCYIPFTTPHSPWAVPQEDWDRFRDKEITQRATQPDREAIDETRCALAMIENQDRNVGRLLATLRELDLEGETIVVYFSDNGPNTFRWTGGMKGRKGTTDEGGIRSPGFIRWPKKIAPGTSVTPIAAAIDLMPTLLALTGVQRIGDKPLDGRDLSPLLVGDPAERGRAAESWPDRTIFSAWAGKVSARTQRYRLDDKGALFDMTDDPGQRQDVSDRFPEVAQTLRSAVEKWRQEMRDEAERKPRFGPSPAGALASVDPRPIDVGHPVFPVTILPARDGEPLGTIKRSAPAPNSSYFVNWTATDDRIVWNVDVKTAGRYEVTIDYTCRQSDVGAVIELSLGEAALRGAVQAAFDPPLYDNQDTLPRPPAESKMKPFRRLSLGQIELPQAAGPLVLRAVEIPGERVIDLRRLTLTLVAP